MAIEYVKHSRNVNTDQMNKYGNLATHDIHVPVLLAYELGKIPDKNGTFVDVNRDFLKETLKATNKYVKNKHLSPFARLFSAWNKDIAEVEAIPIIKNHKVEDVDGKIGYLKGLLYTQEHEGKLSLWGNAVITDPDAKTKVEGDLFRNTSFGTRGDGSIKELSVVVNEAIPHGGFVMSEPEPEKQSKKKSQAFSELQEEISELQFQENHMANVIIPNHIRLAKLIKTGRIKPYEYDNLITNVDSKMLELMERSIPAVNLGIMYGTKLSPVVNKSNEDVLINTIVNKYQKDKSIDKAPTKSGNKRAPQQKLVEAKDSFISQPFQFEEARERELRHILELAEHAPEIASQYIKVELGEETQETQDNDKYLNEYLAHLKTIKSQLKSKQIQLGEFNE